MWADHGMTPYGVIPAVRRLMVVRERTTSRKTSPHHRTIRFDQSVPSSQSRENPSTVPTTFSAACPLRNRQCRSESQSEHVRRTPHYSSLDKRTSPNHKVHRSVVFRIRRQSEYSFNTLIQYKTDIHCFYFSLPAFIIKQWSNITCNV